MLPGLVRFIFLIVFLFVTACAGDAAPPMMGGDTNIRPEPEHTPPNDAGITDTTPSGKDTEGLEDIQVPQDSEISEDTEVAKDTEISQDSEIAEDTENSQDTELPTPSCVAHTDCVDDELCILEPGSENYACVTPSDCATDSECTQPKICAFDYNLDTPRTVCLEPVGASELGDFCTDDAQCASNLCLNEQCATTCKRSADCSNNGSFLCGPQEIDHASTTKTVNVCTPKPPKGCTWDRDCNAPERCVLKSTAASSAFVCAMPPAGGKEFGAACAINAECASNLCLDNVCKKSCIGNHQCDVQIGHTCEAVEITHNGNATNVSVCQPPVECKSNGQCELNEVCLIRKANNEVQTHCKPPNPPKPSVGTGKVGASCDFDKDCASNLCLEGRFNIKHCADACIHNNDCSVPAGSPATYECKPVDIKHAVGNGSDSVNVCVAKDPPPCTSQAGCGAGTHCAVVTNAANTAIETVCIPSTSGRPAGDACTSDTQCRGRLCLGGTCSQPCTNRDQCGSQQLCRVNNVTKPGLNKSVQVCETPPLTECSSNADCTDGVRICGDYRTYSNPYRSKSYCSFPNATGGSTGARCTADSQCRSNNCFFVTNQCSVVCTQDSQCGGSNQICTPYLDHALCASTCINNSSCNTGQSCTVNLNPGTSSFDHVCELHAGPGIVGTVITGPVDDPNPGSQCQSGLIIWRGDESAPRYCTAICDPSKGNADCTGGVSGNPLTVCGQVRLTSGSVVQHIWACGMP